MIEVDVSGAEETAEMVAQVRETFDFTGEWVVGTDVEYSAYVEFGTSRMPAYPYLRPALRRVAAKADTIVEGAKNLSDALRRLAQSIEREAKKIITEKGLIDTGTLKASISAERKPNA